MTARIRAERVVAILRHAEDVDARVEQLVRTGIRVVEITLDSADALGAIERIGTRGDVSVLAGTVRSAAQVAEAATPGAEACVSPGLMPEVVDACRAAGVPAIPGALTPTEVEAAWRRW